MGKPRVKTIDDSQPQAEEPKKEKRTITPRKGKQDSLVAKLSEELGLDTNEARGDGEEGSRRTPAVSETSEDVRRDTEPAGPRAKKIEKAKTSTRIRSKKYTEAINALNEATKPERAEDSEEEVEVQSYKDRSYKVHEAIELVKKASFTKFPGTLEAHINTRNTGIRGLISLPFASGQKRVIAAFGEGADKCGADIVGDDNLFAEIEKGKISFDILVVTPSQMPKFAKLAKTLGPKGLMPNPKNGTISTDLKKAVESFQGGQTEYRTENKAAVIHIGLGKLAQPTEELEANAKLILQTLGKSRIKKVTLAPTMGPSVKIDLNSI